MLISGRFCNDLFREAQKSGIEYDNVHIMVKCNWGKRSSSCTQCLVFRLGSTAQFPKELVEELIAGATAQDQTKALLVAELVVPAQIKATKVELKG